MSQVQTQRLQRTIGTLQIVIIVLVILTALVHLKKGIGVVGGGGGGAPRGAAGGPPPGGGGAGGGGGFNIMQILPLPLPVLFLLNGIGYLVLVAALYLPALARYQPIVRWLLIAFTAVTVVMYFLVSGFRLNPIGWLDKLAEVALIVLLLIEGRRASSAPVGEAVPT